MVLRQYCLHPTGQLEVIANASFWIGDEMDGSDHAAVW